MKTLGFFALALVLLGASSVRAQDVGYNFAQGEDFTKYKTYKWVKIQNAEAIDDITAKQITTAIEAQLATKGLTKVDTDNPDLLISYQTATGTQQQLNSYSTGYGYGPGWRYGGGFGGTTTITSTTILTGQLVLDMYDAAKKELVWRGTATKTLDPQAKPDKRAKNINKAAQKLLKNYPPKVKK